MADILDNTQEQIEFLDEIKYKLLMESISDHEVESALWCDCGNEIPARRRAILPGVKNCVDCQEHIERGLRVERKGHNRNIASFTYG